MTQVCEGESAPPSIPAGSESPFLFPLLPLLTAVVLLLPMLAGCVGQIVQDQNGSPLRSGEVIRYEGENSSDWLEVHIGTPGPYVVDRVECQAVPLRYVSPDTDESGDPYMVRRLSHYCLDTKLPVMTESFRHQSYLDLEMETLDYMAGGSRLEWTIASHAWAEDGIETFTYPRPDTPGVVKINMSAGLTVFNWKLIQYFGDGPPATFNWTVEASGPRGGPPERIHTETEVIFDESNETANVHSSREWRLVKRHGGGDVITADREDAAMPAFPRNPGPWPSTRGAGILFSLEEARSHLNASLGYLDYRMAHPEAYPVFAGYVDYDHAEADRRIFLWHLVFLDERDAFQIVCNRIIHNEYPVPFTENYCGNGESFQLGTNHTTFSRPTGWRSIPDVLEAWRSTLGDPRLEPTVLRWSLLTPPFDIDEESRSRGYITLELSSLPPHYTDTGAGPLYQVTPPTTAEGAVYGPRSGWNLTSGEWYTIARDGLSGAQEDSPWHPWSPEVDPTVRLPAILSKAS